jgi:glucosamine-6-phosphate deaminase
MRLIVRDDAVSAAHYAAKYILKRLKEFEPSQSRPFVLGLPTGSTPIEVYKILTNSYQNGEVRPLDMTMILN